MSDAVLSQFKQAAVEETNVNTNKKLKAEYSLKAKA